MQEATLKTPAQEGSRHSFLMSIILIAMSFFPPTSFGECNEDHYDWLPPFGDWSIPENWEHSEWDPEQERCVHRHGVPQPYAWVHIEGDETAIITGTCQVTNITLWGALIQTGGNVTISGSLDNYGTYQLHQGSINAQHVDLDGTFLQTSGNVTISGSLFNDGTYELQEGSLNANNLCVFDGATLLQTGGNAAIPEFLGVVSRGTYELQEGTLNANLIHVTNSPVEPGAGSVVQTGGTLTCEYALVVSNGGTYELRQGSLNANMVLLFSSPAEPAGGTFVQTEGSASVQTLTLGGFSDCQCTYRLLGGTLSVGEYIEVGLGDIGGMGVCIGVFESDEGVINGTTEDATLWVYVTGGSLIGPGTFNINVVYESDAIFGTSGYEPVLVGFLPNCLTEGGLLTIAQITPADFAGGNVSNLLESSVFDVSFDGSFCGEFTIEIPYDESEVDDLGAMGLVILHETGPETYERLDVVDHWYGGISAKAHSFGKFAVGGPEKEFVVPWILVPGWKHVPNVWEEFKTYLVEENIPFAEVELPQQSEPDQNAEILALSIEQIREENGWFGKINLICHSQGGLDARAYVRDLGAMPNVDSVVMIGTPNHGTFLGNIAGVRWLTPGWVNNFNETAPPFKNADLNRGVHYYTVAGSVYPSNWLLFGQDDGVVPVDSVRLEGSTHLKTFLYDHNQLLEEQDVFELIKDRIDPPSPTQQEESLAFVNIKKGKIYPLETITEYVTIDNQIGTTFTLLSEGNLCITLKSPSGQFITRETTDPNVSYHSGEMVGLLEQSYAIGNPLPGIWQVSIGESAEIVEYTLFASTESEAYLTASTDDYFYQFGDYVIVSASMSAIATIDEICVDVIKPDGSEEFVELYDDGLHHDGSPNDGLYGNFFTPDATGDYVLIFSAQGSVESTNFSRADLLSIFVVSSWLSISTVEEEVIDTNDNALYDRLVMRLIVDVQEHADYSVYGILHKNEKEVARSLPFSEQLYSGIQPIEITFEGKEIYSSGVNGLYSLDIIFTDANGSYVGGENDVYMTTYYFFTQFEPTGEHPIYNLEGDVNGDSVVDIIDFAFLSSQWLRQQCDEPDWCQESDLDYSGSIDFIDYTIVAAHWLWEKISVDFDIDGNVDFLDYAILVDYWMSENCAENNWCDGADLNKSGQVDLLDVAALAEYWLEDTNP